MYLQLKIHFNFDNPQGDILFIHLNAEQRLTIF